MKRTLHLFLICFFIPFAVVAQPGSFDPDFGTNGRVATNSDRVIWGLALQPDGKIIAAGSVRNIVNDRFVVARYLPDGTYDNEFGVNGRVSTLIGDECTPYSLALQPDGKIVVAGASSVYQNNNRDANIAVARYNTDGSLDTSFNNTGVLTMPLASSNSISVVKVQQDGKILLAGNHLANNNSAFLLMRLFEDGSVDESFNVNGSPDGNTGGHKQITAMEILPDGSILACGRIRDGIHIVKYTSAGLPDENFGNNGWVSLTSITGTTYMPGMTILENGDFIIAGGIMPSTKYIGILVKLSANGSLVESFGENGILYNDVGEGLSCQAKNVAVSRGKLVVAYSSGTTGNYDFNVSAYDMNGVPDTTFGNNGSNIFTFARSGHDYLRSMVIQPDDKILVGGSSFGGGFSMARLMPVDAVAGTENFTKNQNKYEVYPNPVTANSVVMIDIKNSGPLTLKLHDAKGMLITTVAENKFFAAGKTEVPLHLPQMEKGVYFLNIQGAGNYNSALKIIN